MTTTAHYFYLSQSERGSKLEMYCLKGIVLVNPFPLAILVLLLWLCSKLLGGWARAVAYIYDPGTHHQVSVHGSISLSIQYISARSRMSAQPLGVIHAITKEQSYWLYHVPECAVFENAGATIFCRRVDTTVYIECPRWAPEMMDIPPTALSIWLATPTKLKATWS